MLNSSYFIYAFTHFPLLRGFRSKPKTLCYFCLKYFNLIPSLITATLLRSPPWLVEAEGRALQVLTCSEDG